MAGLGGLELVSGAPLPGLHPFAAWPAWAVRGSGASLLLLAVTSIAWRPAAWALAAHWTLALALIGGALLSSATNPLAWVPFSQAALFAAVAVRCAAPSAAPALRLAFGAMLVLFGAIHLTQRELIASLIPAWVPEAELWPWLTGGVQVAAGLLCLSRRRAWLGAVAVAAMYASWLVVVHAPRLLAQPGSVFEWTFALTAAALAAIALVVGAESAAFSRAGAPTRPPDQQ